MTGNDAKAPNELARLLTLSGLVAFGSMSMDTLLASLPVIAEQLASTPSEVQFTMTAFLIGYAIGAIVYGPLADRFGRQRVLATSIALYIGACGLCAVSNSVETLIASRFLQALGGSAAPVCARAMVRDLYSREQTVRFFSLMMMLMSLSPFLATLAGGYLLVWFGWRSIFWLQAIYALTCLLFSRYVIGETAPVGAPLKIRALFGGYGEILRDRDALGYNLIGAFAFFGFFAFVTSSPFIYIDLFQIQPQHYAYYFCANVVGMFTGSYLNSRLSMRYGLRPLLKGWTTIMAVGGMALLLTTWLWPNSLLGLLAAVVVYMLPGGAMLACSTAGVVGRFPHRAGTAAALAGFSQFAFGALGAWLVSVLHDGTAFPMAVAMAVGGLLCFASHQLLVRET